MEKCGQMPDKGRTMTRYSFSGTTRPNKMAKEGGRMRPGVKTLNECEQA